MEYAFIAVGVIMAIAVIITLMKVVKGTHLGTVNTNSDGDKETSRLCETLGGEELFNLANGLVDEDGGKKDVGLWKSFMSAAAKKSCVPAMREWGKYCKFSNNNEAVFWLERAANAGDAQAGIELGKIYYYGANYGNPIIEKNRELAAKWFKQFAEAGDAAAQKEYGDYLMCEKKDDKAALEWYEKSAEQGFAEAVNEIADNYYYNEEPEKALENYLKAAKLGSSDAEHSLGEYYSDLDEPDYKEAFGWYLKAAEHGDTIAMCRVGEMYLEGKGVLKDCSAAVEWFEKPQQTIRFALFICWVSVMRRG